MPGKQEIVSRIAFFSGVETPAKFSRIEGSPDSIEGVTFKIHQAAATAEKKQSWGQCDRKASATSKRYAPFIDLVRPADTYIDFGCGDGQISAVLSTMLSAKTYCVDMTPPTRIADRPIEFVDNSKGKALSLIRKEGKVDFISCINSLHHAALTPKELVHLLDDITKTVTPGGHLLVREHDSSAQALDRIIFEHLVYEAMEIDQLSKKKFFEWMCRYKANHPAFYFSRTFLVQMLTKRGWKLIKTSKPIGPTRLYNALFKLRL
jgi:2-polyprenyl-3-methyl-5-hydroxy-6-metoxy-1,4-benzoquinol methylase